MSCNIHTSLTFDSIFSITQEAKCLSYLTAIPDVHVKIDYVSIPSGAA